MRALACFLDDFGNPEDTVQFANPPGPAWVPTCLKLMPRIGNLAVTAWNRVLVLLPAQPPGAVGLQI